MDNFFNARSMLTPGIAGATAMMITSSLVAAFRLPGSYVALGISLLLGLVAMSDDSIRVPQRIIFYVLNSLVIFSMAFGLNAAGVEAFSPAHRPVAIEGETMAQPEIAEPEASDVISPGERSIDSEPEVVVTSSRRMANEDEIVFFQPWSFSQ